VSVAYAPVLLMPRLMVVYPFDTMCTMGL
jgi:hypothetical protein